MRNTKHNPKSFLTAPERHAAALARIERFKATTEAIKALDLPTLLRARVCTPGRAELLVSSMELVANNPFSLFTDALAGDKTLELPKGFNKMAFSLARKCGLKVTKGDANAAALEGWAVPGVVPTREHTVRLLKAAGAVEVKPDAWMLHDLVIDTRHHAVAGHPVKTLVAFTPDGSTVIEYAPEAALFWIVLGALQGMAEGGNARRQFLGYIRVMYAKAAENGGYGHKDGMLARFLEAKLPVFQLGWSATGYTLRSTSDRPADEYATTAAKRKATGSHGQGKFKVNLKAGALAIEVVEGTNGADDTVYVASTSFAKWFKRLTGGMPLQVPLLNPDTSNFRIHAEGESTGRKVQVLLLEDGLNFPYLGNAISLLSRKGLASVFRAQDEVVYSREWTGAYQPALPAVGDRVKVGQVLAQGPDPIVAEQTGVVVEAWSNTQDRITAVFVKTARMDRTGQFKGRSQVFKTSVAYPRWINPNWDLFAEANGLPKPQKVSGDFCVFAGLEPTDNPVLVGNQDVVKATSSGNAAGQVSLAADTVGQKVIYSPKADAEGAYEDLKTDFKAQAYRPEMVVGYAVLDEIAKAMVAAERTDCEFFPTRKGYTFVVQRTPGWVAMDTLKVESLSVRNSLTTGHAMLEVACDLHAKGLDASAWMIVRGGEQLVKELVAVHTASRGGFDQALVDAALEAGVADEQARLMGFTLNGHPLSQLGIATVDVTNLTEGQMEALATRSSYVLGLPKRTAFVDSEDGTVAVIDPVVLAAFGRGAHESSLCTLFTQLCHQCGNGNVEEAKRLVRQIAGCLKAIAKSRKVNQRAFRGAETLQAKTSAGNVPQGWVAISYHGAVAKRLARMFGFDKLSADELKERGWFSPVDGLFGELVYNYRAPQTAALPLRIYMPDAPQAVLDSPEVSTLLPAGGIFHRQIACLEPHRYFLSPFDTAFDNGDHDGDGRNLVAITCAKAKAEALAWTFDAEQYRQDVLTTYQANPADPVVEAYRQDAKKRKWSKVGVVPYGEFVSLSVDSIKNQTSDIGLAYNLAHLALTTFGDLSPKRGNALKAMTFFVGHYEEQLAGLNKAYRALYSLLLSKEAFTAEDGTVDLAAWQQAVTELNEGKVEVDGDKVEHNADDTKALFRLAAMLEAAKAFENGDKVELQGDNLQRALLGRLVRQLSRGVFDGNGKVVKIFSKLETLLGATTATGVTFRAFIADNAALGSVGCFALDRFITELAPFIDGLDASEDDTDAA